jgi:hypothetical protein
MKGYMNDFSWPDVENTPEIAGYHLLYEIYKKRARLMIENEEAPQDKADTFAKSKQKETLKLMQRKYKLAGKKCMDWIRDNKDCLAITNVTAYNYWREMESELNV